MSVVKCELPSASAMDPRLLERAYFTDAYRAPLKNSRAGMVDVFFAVFGHHPLWIKLILVVRNSVAKFCGLATPSTTEMMSTEIKGNYAVGDKIGVWPLYLLTETEIIAGRDNKHLDFRVSVLREEQGGNASVTVSTLCAVNNTAGKIYLFFIVPFHKWGVQRMLSRALAANRL
ncbi:MAG: DUF2867 domain-containing protein [Candidatus Obscuribacterales bacterium]|nr:DUF2867 domain-containing protein [Steroidobacteraceae bacterium]